MDKSLVSVSKFLSLVLRHKPSVIKAELDSEGWISVDELIAKSNESGKLRVQLTRELIIQVVAENEKRRFAMCDDGQRIRASQGHSLESVTLDLKPVTPPEHLFHGTVERFLDSIRTQGLRKRERNHVHLSAEIVTAQQVGNRRGQPVILKISSLEMFASGYEFFLSDNEVWLTDSVPVKFIEFPIVESSSSFT